MIGIDLNNISIKKLKKFIKYTSIFIKGSIDNPEFIFKQLYIKNIDPNLILQVRSFIDHERTIKVLVLTNIIIEILLINQTKMLKE